MSNLDKYAGNIVTLVIFFFLGITLGGVITGVYGLPAGVFGLIGISTCFWTNRLAKHLAQRLILWAGIPAAFVINLLSTNASASNLAQWAVNLPQARIAAIIGATIGLIIFVWQMKRPQKH